MKNGTIQYSRMLFRRFRFQLAGLFVTRTLGILSELGISYAMGVYVNNIEADRSLNYQSFVYIAIILFFSILLLRFSFRYIWGKTIVSIDAAIKRDLQKEALYAPLNWNASKHSGGTARRIIRAATAACNLVEIAANDILPNVALILGVFVISLFKWPIIGIIFFTIASFYVLLGATFTYFYTIPSIAKAKKFDTRISALLVEQTGFLETIKSYCVEKSEIKLLENETGNWKKHAEMAWTRSAIVEFFQGCSLVLGLLFLFIYIFFLIENGNIQTGDIIFLVSATLLTVNNLKNTGQSIRKISNSLVELNDLKDLFLSSFLRNEHSAEENKSLNRKSVRGETTIEFVNVSFRYPDADSRCLENLNLKIEHGEKIAIVGESGSGKSTIFKLLLGNYKPECGEILVNRLNQSMVPDQE